MPVPITKLQEIYNTPKDSPENKAWIAIPDSRNDTLHSRVNGSSGGTPGNGWKIHISIDPSKMDKAAELILQALNEENSPRVSIKFAGKALAATGQPSKQAAFIFYQEELQHPEKITAFLNRVEELLKKNDIGVDPRPINTDPKDVKTKYDASILDDTGKPSRFNYRNESCIVMEHETYLDCGGTGNFTRQGENLWVNQDYYLSLPDTQKHNPGNAFLDPLTSLRVTTPKIEVRVDPLTTPSVIDEPILIKPSLEGPSHSSKPSKSGPLPLKTNEEYTKLWNKEFHQRIAHDAPNTKEAEKIQRIRNVLDDYTKGGDTWWSWVKRVVSGHWNRHHVSEVAKIVKDIDNNQYQNSTDLIKNLEDLSITKKANPVGEFKSRIDFIKANDMEDLKPPMIGLS